MKKENGKAKDKLKEKTGPVVDPAAAQQLNMMVLKRYDSDIEEVLANSAHVTMYTLNVDTKQWARKQVEGSLFLIRRKSLPTFQLLVLNKLSTDNYVETLHDALDFEVHPPYLMYTHGNDEVVGVWFYENQDLEKVAGILDKIKLENPKDVDAAPTSAVTEAAPPPAATSAAPDSTLQEASTSNLQDLLFRAHQRHQQQHQQHQAQPTRTLQSKPANGNAPQPPQAGVQAPANIPVRPFPPQQAPPSAVPTQANDRKGSQPSPTAHPVERAASQQTPDTSPSFRELPAAGQLFATPPKPEAEGNVLHKLFARAMQPASSATTPSSSPAAPAAQQLQHPQQSQQQRPDPAVRDKVRQAFGRLLQSDAFVDMLATEFKSAGLLT